MRRSGGKQNNDLDFIECDGRNVLLTSLASKNVCPQQRFGPVTEVTG